MKNFKIRKLRINIEFFNSKVARRVTGLFLLSALVPLITTAFLSKTYITNILIEQGYTNLQSEGKYYVKSIFDRLQHIEKRLTDIAETLNKSNNKSIILNKNQGDEFTSLVKEKITKTSIIESNYIKDNKIHIYSRTMSNGKTSVFMSLQLEQSYKNTTTLLTAELASDYLWDSKSKTYNIFNVCIVNEGGGVLYCSKEIPETITLNNSQRTFNNKKIERWSSKDGDYISASKTLFLKSKFDSTNWKVLLPNQKKTFYHQHQHLTDFFLLLHY